MELALPLAIGMTAETRLDGEESDLVAASLDGDQVAFAVLVRRHQHRVFRLAGRFFRRREDVEDVAQDTFTTAWRRLGTYAARAPFEHWITRVCLRVCYARLGAERRRDAPLEARDAIMPPRDVATAIDVERLLARLAPADRFVLEFERPVVELERQIDELLRLDQSETLAGEIDSLRHKARVLQREIFAELKPWQKVQLSRHPGRPYTLDYL